MFIYFLIILFWRFIELVDGQEMIASVRNQEGDVISLPPITNGEKTKVGFSIFLRSKTY